MQPSELFFRLVADRSRLVLRPALRQPGDDDFRRFLVGVDERRHEFADALVRSAARVVVGDDAHCIKCLRRRRSLRPRYRSQKRQAVRRGGAGQGVGQVAVGEVGRVEQRFRHRGARLAVLRQFGEGQQGGKAHIRVRVGEHAAVEDRFRGLLVARQHRDGVAADTRGFVLQGCAGRRGRLLVGAVERLQAVQRPKGVDRTDVQADLIRRGVAGQVDQRGHHVLLTALHEQPLGVQPPEHVVVFQCRHQLRGTGVFERERRLRLRSLRNEPIDAPVFLVAQLGLVSAAGAGLEAGRRRVVLHNERVPVDQPDGAVGAHLRHDRGAPLVVAGEQVPAVVRVILRPVVIQHQRRGKVAGRVGDESGAVPVGFRIRAGGVERVAGGGGELAVPVDLAHLVGDRVELRAVGDHRQHRRRPAAHRLIIAVGDRQVDTRVAVRG